VLASCTAMMITAATWSGDEAVRNVASFRFRGSQRETFTGGKRWLQFEVIWKIIHVESQLRALLYTA